MNGISPLGYWQKVNQSPTQTKPYNIGPHTKTKDPAVHSAEGESILRLSLGRRLVHYSPVAQRTSALTSLIFCVLLRAIIVCPIRRIMYDHFFPLRMLLIKLRPPPKQKVASISTATIYSFTKFHSCQILSPSVRTSILDEVT